MRQAFIISFTDELKHRELFNMLRQNFKMVSQVSQLLIIQSNTNLATAVKSFIDIIKMKTQLILKYGKLSRWACLRKIA